MAIKRDGEKQEFQVTDVMQIIILAKTRRECLWCVMSTGTSLKRLEHKDSVGRGGLVCYNSWGHKESDTIERLN